MGPAISAVVDTGTYAAPPAPEMATIIAFGKPSISSTPLAPPMSDEPEVMTKGVGQVLGPTCETFVVALSEATPICAPTLPPPTAVQPRPTKLSP